jgi:hypothetical protein
MNNSTIVILGLLLIVLLYLIYLLYKWYNSPLVSSTTLKINNSAITIPVSMLPSSSRYSYGMWLYGNTWDNTKLKPIFSRITAAGVTTPQIKMYLDETTPTLRLNIANMDGVMIAGNAMVVTDSFPLQKWVFVLVSVDNQYIDMYLDGKLIMSMKLSYIPYVPGSSTATVNLGKDDLLTWVSSDIFVSNFQYWAYPLSPQDAWNTYMRGNGGSIFSSIGQYSATVTISKNNETAAVVPVF